MSHESDSAFESYWKKEHHKLDCGQAAARVIWEQALNWARPLAADKIGFLRTQVQDLLAALDKQKQKAKADAKPPKKPAEKPADQPKTRFSPPTVEELSAYMREQGFTDWQVTAQAFIDYYETRGWVPNGCRHQMRSWKAAVRTWKHNGFPVHRKGDILNGDVPPGLPVDRESQRKADQRYLEQFRRENDLRLGLTSGGTA